MSLDQNDEGKSSTKKRHEMYRQIAKHNNARFLMDLEFIECLADPHYIHSLVPYFDNPAFLNYIKYLTYFRQPEYVIYIQYPHALYFLEQLQIPEFCHQIRNNPAYLDLLLDQCEAHLKYGRKIEYDEFVEQMQSLDIDQLLRSYDAHGATATSVNMMTDMIHCDVDNEKNIDSSSSAPQGDGNI